MQIYFYPPKDEWKELAERPHFQRDDLEITVTNILSQIKKEGDKSLYEFEEKFDRVKLESLKVSPQEFENAIKSVPDSLKLSIKKAAENITKFHEAQKFEPIIVETTPGVTCWQKSVAIEKVGLYIPGGTAPLFSTVLMLAIPAQIAGCKKIVLCSPPREKGELNPAIIYAGYLSGVTEIFTLGCVPAIGAMAYGTESVEQIFTIFGPVNQYFTHSTQILCGNDVA